MFSTGNMPKIRIQMVSFPQKTLIDLKNTFQNSGSSHSITRQIFKTDKNGWAARRPTLHGAAMWRNGLCPVRKNEIDCSPGMLCSPLRAWQTVFVGFFSQKYRSIREISARLVGCPISELRATGYAGRGTCMIPHQLPKLPPFGL